MISKEEVRHISKLARIDLTENEIEKMQKDLSGILDYFNVIKNSPVAKKNGVPDSVNSVNSENSALREDQVVSSYDIKDKLILAAPEKKDDYIKVKQIL